MYKINLPDDVKMILNHLNFHGYEAYVVGGAIRSQIINQFYGTSHKIKDYDIVTNAPYELLPAFFCQYNPKLIGEKFGVIQIEVNNEKAELFVNNLKYSCLIVNKMLGINKKGAIALFVDVDTIGYFKNIKIIRK